MEILLNNLNCCRQRRIQDFPGVGVPILQRGRQHTILPNFPKNCMTLKEFGPPEGASLAPLLDPPLVDIDQIYDVMVPCLI